MTIVIVPTYYIDYILFIYYCTNVICIIYYIGTFSTKNYFLLFLVFLIVAIKIINNELLMMIKVIFILYKFNW